MTISTLIDKQDTAELVRDQIAQILANETASQQALAVADGQDPKFWELQVTTERATPWNKFIEAQGFAVPIINVWFDTDSFAPNRGNTTQRQTATGTFNVDCYGYGTPRQNGTGHDPGDELAAKEAQRAARLCRNILMADDYTYLDFARGQGQLVEKRWLQTRTSFQPQLDDRAAQRVVAVRLAFAVTYDEYAPQYEPETLEYVATEIKRDADDFILANVDFDYTT